MLKELSLTTLGVNPLYRDRKPSFLTTDIIQSIGFLYLPGLFMCLVVQMSSGDPKTAAVNAAPEAHKST